MKATSISKRKSSTLASRYQASLSRYIRQGQAAGLKPAVKLGRQAVALKLETLELSMIHEKALVVQILPIRSSTARNRVMQRAAAFFAGAILPMEETHRSAVEANVKLRRLNEALNRRTLDLAASNRQLKKEIVKRKVVEQTLRKSEQQSIRLLEQSRHMQEQMRHLSRAILSAQEEERKRISRELHDVIGQVLTSINVRLAVLKTEATVNTKGLAKSILHAQRLVEKSVNIVRRFAYNLRPSLLDDLGLVACLDSFMAGFMKETGIRASLTAFAGVDNLSSAKRTTLYRVAQEALTNVGRHSRASRVDVTIERLANRVRMQIKDNGKSFDVQKKWHIRKRPHLGLLGMRERLEMVGGSFCVESSPGKGTTIKAEIPFDKGAKEHSLQ